MASLFYVSFSIPTSPRLHIGRRSSTQPAASCPFLRSSSHRRWTGSKCNRQNRVPKNQIVLLELDSVRAVRAFARKSVVYGGSDPEKVIGGQTDPNLQKLSNVTKAGIKASPIHRCTEQPLSVNFSFKNEPPAAETTLV
jgi:hypothetical protein